MVPDSGPIHYAARVESRSIDRLVRYARAVASIVARRVKVRARPIHMQIEPTSKCNLECPMCLRKEVFGAGSHMGYALFERVFQQVRPLHMTLNGQGEPLLNRDIFRMISLAESNGCRVNLTSNGNFLYRFYGDLIDSKLTLLSVSLDSVDPEAYRLVRSKDRLDQTLAGLEALQAEKKKRGVTHPVVRISSVMMQATLDHARAFVDKAAELGIQSVLFQPMALFGKWDNLALMGPYADRAKYQETLQGLDAYARSKGIDTNLDQVLADFAIVVQNYDAGVGVDHALSKGCPFPWFSLYVRADGKVHPCCVRSYATTGFVGDLSKQDMGEIWNSDAYQDVRRVFRDGKTLPYKECVGCAPPTLPEMIGKTRYTPAFMRLVGR
jgi:MoaA/NifB/PqqE/SkfB family radical SAM enzyme